MIDTGRVGELEYARRLAVDLRAGMLLPGDRNFAAAGVPGHRAAAAPICWCAASPAGRRRRCRDGSTLARLGALTVRVIDAEIGIRTVHGACTGRYRLLPTLTDPGLYPALELVRLYHERWEIELRRESSRRSGPC
ncbi:hypothetical protein [Herbidospora yilanensis]|uniref:hypothetical protein n=1 Tax=Herbidospora yilanensis TaxID=354426 RepID=UPI0012FC256F|nr:hypothetical protein [Herbidospora yilanensis]